jgi:hypothetical protein
MLRLISKKLIHYICLILKGNYVFNNFLLVLRGIKILADIVNKFTYNPGPLFKDEIILVNDAGDNYWHAGRCES